MRLILTVFAVVYLAVSSSADTDTIPAGWIADPALSLYLRTIFLNLRETLKEGSDELNIRSVDPLTLGNNVIKHDKKNAKIDGSFNNMVLTGLSNFEVKRVRGGFRPPLLDLELNFPTLVLRGDYNINGKIARIFPLYGNGPFTLTFHNMKLTGATRMLWGDNRKLRVDRVKLDASFERANFDLQNFLGGGDLGMVMNRVLSLVSKMLFDKVKPKMLEKQEAAITKKLNRGLQEYSYEQIFGILGELS